MSDWVLSLPFALASRARPSSTSARASLALGVLPGNRKPSTAMAWLILILAVPYFGILAFLLFGSTSVGRKRRAWQSEVNERVLAAVQQAAAADLAGRRPRGDAATASTGSTSELGALPLAAGNTVELLRDYRGVDRRDAGRGGRGRSASCTWSSTSRRGTT